VSVALRLPNRERGLLSSVPHLVARGCRPCCWLEGLDETTAFSDLIVSPWRWRDKMSDDGSAICCQLSPDAVNNNVLTVRTKQVTPLVCCSSSATDLTRTLNTRDRECKAPSSDLCYLDVCRLGSTATPIDWAPNFISPAPFDCETSEPINTATHLPPPSRPNS
jgi:hypothetical protein